MHISYSTTSCAVSSDFLRFTTLRKTPTDLIPSDWRQTAQLWQRPPTRPAYHLSICVAVSYFTSQHSEIEEEFKF